MLTIVIFAFALSLDAFAVSISCGIKLKHLKISKYIKIALAFGWMQALMPILGWAIGTLIKDFVMGYAHYLVFVIFTILGGKTLFASYSNWQAKKGCCDGGKEELLQTSDQGCECKRPGCLTSLAIATSIDAFLLGPVLALYNIPLVVAVAIVGAVTFVVCFVGPFIGYKSGKSLGAYAELLAGVILIALALKILIEKAL
ncbi:MAG: manganese efflux pump [Oligoflexia bacterium]|nr:manganese efflux pump [Oligoflexia bacterium]MBF0366558.1 manganese efflux pump [Oligoflexia bacterium]